MFLEVDAGNNNCLDTDFITPNPFLGQKFLIEAGSTFVAHLFRKDGHGCDGRQGEFQARPIFLDNNTTVPKQYQKFSFDSNGAMAAVGDEPDYTSTLLQANSGATALWTVGGTKAIISDEQKLAAMRTCAPLIWAAEGEEYFACSTEWSFQFLTRVTREGQYWLYTKQDLSSPSDDSLPLFKGNLAEAPVYAFWVEKAGGNYDICYFTYYGYNRGKEVVDTIWGNHVGDWEHLTVRLDSQLNPISVYMSQHSGGETISWADVEKSGTHPVAYAAWGSHALYSSGGDHVYSSVLVDKCGKGTQWNTWDRVETYDYGAKTGLGSSVWPTWMTTDYTSTLPGKDAADPRSGGIYRWGNGGNGATVAGQRQLEDGPTGPIDKGDCWDRSTFG
ncbi:Vps62-related protein [Sphingomonas sp.]|uniref:Vps62-related protein n=1 Tax=Sphingomonas sp. TaxID=28214 RepID=UPI002E37CB2B|nr:Vps62-related protein [Sphingomonas sp.]HEX4694895.1 Vps62-related protein [Sphingomonas sp.]